MSSAEVPGTEGAIPERALPFDGRAPRNEPVEANAHRRPTSIGPLSSAAGKSQMPLITHAAMLGGNVRIN
jgi:uncharacterized protein (DUF849 family)